MKVRLFLAVGFPLNSFFRQIDDITCSLYSYSSSIGI